MQNKRLRLVYVTPSLHVAGGVERVLTLKANYLADEAGYDVSVVLTDGAGLPPFYPLSPRVRVIQLDIGFEQLWKLSFWQKIPVYLRKQRAFRRQLTSCLCELKPDVTVSLLRREINFLCDIADGSKKVGELHVNRANYRNFEANDSNAVKRLFARYWMRSLVKQLRRLDRFVVLTHEDAQSWPELSNVEVIADPLPFVPEEQSTLTEKRVIAVGRYAYQKGFDMLLRAWSLVQHRCEDWTLDIFGAGDRQPYRELVAQLNIDQARCHLNGPTSDIRHEYLNSGLLAFSSRFEGFGMVLPEAMSCGLPVVAFACPCGPKDIVSDGSDGLLVEPGNVEALAAAMLRLMTDPRLRHDMGHRASLKARKYDLAVIGPRWQKLFEAL